MNSYKILIGIIPTIETVLILSNRGMNSYLKGGTVNNGLSLLVLILSNRGMNSYTNMSDKFFRLLCSLNPL